MGPYNIAEKSYEQIVLKPLLKTKTLESVKFTGVLGGEKKEIIQKAKVAIAPNDKETFCISALEYVLSGVPVVGVSSGGINDVIQNKKTGILCRTKLGMRRNIIKIFKEKRQFEKLTDGLDYFKHNFDVELFIKEWKRVIDEVDKDAAPRKIKAKKPYGDKYKIVGLILKLFRTIFRFPDSFSRVGIASKISRWKRHE